jgi:hypothetical protein
MTLKHKQFKKFRKIMDTMQLKKTNRVLEMFKISLRAMMIANSATNKEKSVKKPLL